MPSITLLAVAAGVLALAVVGLRIRRMHRSAGEQYRALFEQNPQPLFVWQRGTGRILAVNRSACETYGFTREEFATMSVLQLRLNDPESQNAPLPEPGSVVLRTHRRRDGTLRESEMHTNAVWWEGQHALMTLLVDVTERNAQERQARRIGRIYATSSKINRVIFGLPDRQSILQSACDIAVEAGDFRLAWIGILNEETEYLDVAAYAGVAPAYLRNIRVTTRADVPEGRGPMGTAVRERRTVADNDFLNSPTALPWREEAARHDLRASLCAPIVQHDRVIGGLGLYGAEPGMFQEQEQRLIVELTNDIALALHDLDHRARLRLDERIRELTMEIYEMVAADAPLDGILATLVGIVTEHSPGSTAKITVGTAGEGPGSPATAIAMPITGSHNQVLGTLCVYGRSAAPPTDQEMASYRSVAQLASIVIERAQAREALEYQALHDALTGLPNRLLFHDRLSQALAAARRHGTRIAVGMIDLDRFKLVNDTLGHAEGDVLLRMVADRFHERLLADETIARMGGDEFLVILTDLKHTSELDAAARRLLGALEQPFQVGGREIYARASLGLALSGREHESKVGVLLQQADKAMYQAKRSGSGYAVHSADAPRVAAVSDLDLESDLHRALQNNEFVLHYQPIVDYVAGRVMGAEALIRWQHPAHGLISPDAFIPIAEATGLITPLGAWTLAAACQQAAQWDRQGFDLPVAVNISARQFAQPGLQALVVQALAQHGLRAGRLWLEVTETSVMESPTAAAEILADLKGIGVRIVIDDFGTGYSSLAYLHKFPIDVLKIDRSFISGMGDSPGLAASGMEIARAVIALAKALNAEVLAEGVETVEQRDALLAFGCRYMQGFLFYQPCPGSEVTQLAMRSQPGQTLP